MDGAANITNQGAGGLAERMGITIVELTADRVVGTMPVEGNTQPLGLLHGGASAALAETLGSLGAAMHGHNMGRPFALGIELNVSHHKSVRTGVVTGVATPLHRGGTVATYEIIVTNEAHDRICTARLTCLLRA